MEYLLISGTIFLHSPVNRSLSESIDIDLATIFNSAALAV